MTDDAMQTSYDRVAEEYARRMLNELDHKPRDRELLDQFAAAVKDRGTVCDLGTGPGQIARYVSDRGAEVIGIDFSPAMVEVARRSHPNVSFRQGDMRALPFPDGALAGITAFYSIIHIPRGEVVDVLKELRRVLQPNGLLLLSFHRGDEVRHLDEWWDQPVSVDFYFFATGEMRGYLEAADFRIEQVVERDPYPDAEAPTQRAYIFARKPSN